jgi:metallophosphoesterase superfamily enzyme
VQETITLLPAFGAFTGGMNIERTTDSRIYVIGDGAIWETP